MAELKKISEHVRVGESGRVTLDDAELDALVAASDIVSAGGDGSVNDGCLNSGDCSGSMNTSNCTNSMACAGSLNAAGECKTQIGVGGGLI